MHFTGYRTYFAATGAVLAGVGAVVTALTVNDYNAATLGILDASYIEAYKNFMIQRKSMKLLETR